MNGRANINNRSSCSTGSRVMGDMGSVLNDSASQDHSVCTAVSGPPAETVATNKQSGHCLAVTAEPSYPNQAQASAAASRSQGPAAVHSAAVHQILRHVSAARTTSLASSFFAQPTPALLGSGTLLGAVPHSQVPQSILGQTPATRGVTSILAASRGVPGHCQQDTHAMTLVSKPQANVVCSSGLEQVFQRVSCAKSNLPTA